MKRDLTITTWVVAFALTSLLLTPSFAAETSASDIQRGAGIVANGTSYGVVACARCHAFDGAADGSGAFPKLSGSAAYYLAKQLKDFASGTRSDAIMSAIARKMKIQDMADVSEYYAGIQGTSTPRPAANPDLRALGKRLATVGDEQKTIQACESCHGLEGRGQSPAIPPLAGQYSHYIAFQMSMWQKGYRKNDANQQMANISGRLSPEDIEAIGLYFERLSRPDTTKTWRQK